MGAPKLVAEWFADTERGRAVGIYSTASSLGNVVALVVASPLRSAFDSWRWVMVVFGLAALSSAAVWVWVARVPGVVTTSSDNGPAWNLLRDRTVRWVMVLAVGVFFLGHAVGGWMPEMLRVEGWSEAGASWLVAAAILFGIVGSVVLPPLATDARRGPMLTGILLLIAVAVWPLLTSSQAAHVVIAPLIGTGRVVLVPIAMLILMSSPSVNAARMGAAGGLFFTAGEIGGVTGPWLTGVTRDLGDDFGYSIAMLSGVAVLLAVAARLATRERLPSPDVRGLPDS